MNREEAAAEVDRLMKQYRESTADGACWSCGAVLERTSDPERIEEYRTSMHLESVPAPETVSLVAHPDDCEVRIGLIKALALSQTWGFEFKFKAQHLPDGSFWIEGFERAPD
jgi:hypothetical protein